MYKKLFTFLFLLFSTNSYNLMNYIWNTNKISFFASMRNSPFPINKVQYIIETTSNQWNLIKGNTLQLNFQGFLDINCSTSLSYSIVCFNNQTLLNPAYSSLSANTNHVIFKFATIINTYFTLNDATLYNILLHEFGHINLLDESNISSSIMGKSIVLNSNTNSYILDTTLARLTIDDVYGIYARIRYGFDFFNNKIMVFPINTTNNTNITNNTNNISNLQNNLFQNQITYGDSYNTLSELQQTYNKIFNKATNSPTFLKKRKVKKNKKNINLTSIKNN